MTDSAADSPSADVTDSAVREMVSTLRPDWRVDAIERSPHGTDFVGILDVRTPERRTVVLKATTADFVDPPIARAEPRLLELVNEHTSIPVPGVYGYCDRHETHPAPFYLMDYVEGDNYEGNEAALSVETRATLIQEAGENLAELHELGPLPAAGKVGVEAGELTVLDTADHPRIENFREDVLANSMETLDQLTDGGYYPELADDRNRFADLVPAVREYLAETIPALSTPEKPTYCHWDYRIGNLLIEPETGETRAVLDWANLSAAEPAYNLAQTEFYLLYPQRDGPERTERLREILRNAYTATRTEWTFDDPTCERIDLYRLTARLGAMACLPLWYQDASPAERTERATEHRAVVERYL
ncbi:phosphotransferase family protein [Halobacteriales archaeon Cl-PHB]